MILILFHLNEVKASIPCSFMRDCNDIYIYIYIYIHIYIVTITCIYRYIYIYVLFFRRDFESNAVCNFQNVAYLSTYRTQYCE